MSNQLRELLQDPCNDSEDEKDLLVQERLRDVSTAFSLLLYHAKINTEDVSQDISEKVSKGTTHIQNCKVDYNFMFNFNTFMFNIDNTLV